MALYKVHSACLPASFWLARIAQLWAENVKMKFISVLLQLLFFSLFDDDNDRASVCVCAFLLLWLLFGSQHDWFAGRSTKTSLRDSSNTKNC